MTKIAVAVAGIGLMLLAACADESARPVLGPPPTDAADDLVVGPPTTVLGAPATVASAPTESQPLATVVERDPLEGLVPLPGFEDVVMRVVNAGEETRWPVLYAGSLESRRQGLMGVTDLRGYTGMVFVFEADTEAAFWMRNTPMPLSLVFLRADGSVVAIVDMEPCADVGSCPKYPPTGPYRFALEVPQGRLPNLDISATTFIGLE
ncbi:MAG: DUF192 domain-containing protein [Actinomycetota bacterium]|nr:DUF192 domain-containing protein [Actinomycetota bacterium]